MKTPAATIRRVTRWLDHKTLRERIGLFTAVLVVVIFCFQALYFNPQNSRHAGITAQITALNATLAALDSQAEAIQARGEADPDQEQRAGLGHGRGLVFVRRYRLLLRQRRGSVLARRRRWISRLRGLLRCRAECEWQSDQC